MAYFNDDSCILEGDASDVLQSIPAEHIQLTVTSPPYFQHRDYEHTSQIGQERTVNEYISKMGNVLRQVHRVTRADGACFIVIGDTYRNSRLSLVPHRLAICADEQGWTVRNDIIWHKLDAAPIVRNNRWRTTHEHILFLTKQPRGYVFDDTCIRQPYSPATIARWGKGQTYGGSKSENRKGGASPAMRHGKSFNLNSLGTMPTDVWATATGSSRKLHYATFPEYLITPMILACSLAGSVVMDPFAGTGTTCIAAKRLGRRYIGIELNPEFAALAKAAVQSVTAGH